MKAQIKADEDKLSGLSGKLEDKKAIAESRFNEAKAKLDADMSVADEYMDKPPIDCTELQTEVTNAEDMKRHLNEYKRMKAMQDELEQLRAQSDEFTRKIGLPVANLSEGEQLSLCVDVAISKPNGLQVILIDGTEKLSSENREKLYSKCHEKGIQFIATRTTDSSEMEVHYI